MRCVLRLAVLLLLSLSSQHVFAQKADYRALTDAAVEEHSLGHYEEARALFARAHEIDPNARTLWGMGVAAFEARQYADAIRLLEAALVHTRKPLTAAQRKQAESLLERSQAFVVRVRFALQPAHASLLIDGREPERDADGVALFDAGTHQVVASAPGYLEHVRSMRWSAGPAFTLEIQLESAEQARAEPEPEVAQREPERPAPTPPPAQEPNRVFRVLKWVSLGAAVGALGVVGAGIGLRESAARTWNDETKCPVPKEESCGDTRDAVQRWENMTIAGGAAAGAFAILSTVFFVLDRKRSPDTHAARALCAPTLQPGAVCSLRF